MSDSLTYNRYLGLQRGIRWQEIRGQLRAMLHCYPSTGPDSDCFKVANEIAKRFIREMEEADTGMV